MPGIRQPDGDSWIKTEPSTYSHLLHSRHFVIRDFVQEELDSMIREIDQDGNGEIDFDEFVHVMSRKVQPTYTPDEVKAAFKVFETPNSGLPAGFVKTQALEKALTTYGSEKLSLEEAQDLLQQVDPENTGSINYVEYVNMMCST